MANRFRTLPIISPSRSTIKNSACFVEVVARCLLSLIEMICILLMHITCVYVNSLVHDFGKPRSPAESVNCL